MNPAPSQRVAILVAAAVLLGVPALAGPPPDQVFAVYSPVDRYRNTTQQELVSCSDSYQSSRQPNARDTDYRHCISVGRRACRTKFESALDAVNKPEAREALRTYHFVFLSALNGIEPEAGEPADGYKRRQDELRHQLQHAWTKFELAE